MPTLSESTVEAAALEWLSTLGWQTAHGPDIAPDTPGAERAAYGQVVLEQRPSDAVLPKLVSGELRVGYTYVTFGCERCYADGIE